MPRSSCWILINASLSETLRARSSLSHSYEAAPTKLRNYRRNKIFRNCFVSGARSSRSIKRLGNSRNAWFCVVDRCSISLRYWPMITMRWLAQFGRSSLCILRNVVLEMCELTKVKTLSFQTISNKHSCCSNSNNINNNCLKVCDNQTTAVHDKEKEVLMAEQEENYRKLRQLLDYDDVRRSLLLITDRGFNWCSLHRLQAIFSSIPTSERVIERCCHRSSVWNRYSGGRTKL